MADQVFISYSRKDDAIMRRIVAFLRGEGINVWVDNEKLVPGTPIWEEEIEKAIKAAGAIVVVMSPDSKNSEWVRREISLAEQDRIRIFPVLVSGDEDSAITIRLITKQFVDIRKNENVGLSSLSTNLLDYLNAETSPEAITSSVVESKPSKFKNFSTSWFGRSLIGVIAGLIAGQIMAMVPSGYFSMDVTTIGLLVVVGGFAGFLSPARKVSIVLMLIGFTVFGSIVGLIDPTNFDANYFIGIGFYLGVPLAGFVARILYWIKVIK